MELQILVLEEPQILEVEVEELQNLEEEVEVQKEEVEADIIVEE